MPGGRQRSPPSSASTRWYRGGAPSASALRAGHGIVTDDDRPASGETVQLGPYAVAGEKRGAKQQVVTQLPHTCVGVHAACTPRPTAAALSHPRDMKRCVLALLAACAAVLAGPPGAGAQPSGGVLVIGDSLEVGTGPYLRQELRGVAPVTVDARTGRPDLTGRRLGLGRLGHSGAAVEAASATPAGRGTARRGACRRRCHRRGRDGALPIRGQLPRARDGPDGVRRDDRPRHRRPASPRTGTGRAGVGAADPVMRGRRPDLPGGWEFGASGPASRDRSRARGGGRVARKRCLRAAALHAARASGPGRRCGETGRRSPHCR